MPRKRKSKRTSLTKAQRKEIRSIANNVAHAMPEKKRFGFQAENIQLFHNKPDYDAAWLSCKQGTADPENLQTRLARIGDEIYLQNVNIRLWLSNKNDRPNVMYKATLFWYDATVSLSDTYVYFTQTNKMLDRINTENVGIIDQKTLFSGPSYATGVASDAGSAKEHSYLMTLNGSWKNKKITYDEGGSVPRFRDIGLCVVCYDAFGTLQTDEIATYAYNGMVTLTDP